MVCLRSIFSPQTNYIIDASSDFRLTMVEVRAELWVKNSTIRFLRVLFIYFYQPKFTKSN